MLNKPIYHRILLKLSGEALMGKGDFGLSANVLSNIAHDIQQVIELGVQVGIVIGGGNFLRGGTLAESGMNRVTGDQLGMLATVMNSLALQDALYQKNVPTLLMSSIDLPGISGRFNHKTAIKAMQKNQAVIIAGGTGNPFFTTDTAACLRGIEIEADIIIKATKVDGVYDKDPMKFADAVRYDTLTYDVILEKKLAVMDLTAITLCQTHAMPLRVINMMVANNLLSAIRSDQIGTLIRKENVK